MAKTLNNARIGVRVYLDEVNQADFLTSEVDRAINFSYHDLVSEVMEVYQEYYLTTTPTYLSTVANQQEYTMDTSLLKIERVEINYKPSDSNSVAYRAVPVKMNQIVDRVGNTSTSAGIYNPGYYIIGSQASQKIGFIPIPTEAGTNNISVWGIQAPSDLSASTDPILIPYPDRFCHLIEQKAAADLLRKGQQEEATATRYITEYMSEVLRMKTFLVERQSDGVNIIQDAEQDYVGFDVPLY